MVVLHILQQIVYSGFIVGDYKEQRPAVRNTM